MDTLVDSLDEAVTRRHHIAADVRRKNFSRHRRLLFETKLALSVADTHYLLTFATNNVIANAVR